jgi:hypothetical protein
MNEFPSGDSHGPLDTIGVVFSSLCSVSGILCLVATLIWAVATGCAFTSWESGWNVVGEGLQLVSILTVPLALMVLPLDKKRGLIGLLGAVVGFIVTVTAVYKVS